MPNAGARGQLGLERVDGGPQGGHPARAHRVEQILLLNLGDIGLGQEDARHQTPVCTGWADSWRIQSVACWWLEISSARIPVTSSAGTSTLVTSRLVVARWSSEKEKRSSPIFSPGRSPV